MTSPRAVRALAQDQALLRVGAALDAAGVQFVLLKGRATADLLGTAATRLAADVDLLVAPDRYATAQQVLSELGFRDVLEAARPDEQMAYESTWRRGVALVDLHRTLLGVEDARRVWEVFSASSDTVQVGGRTFACASRPVRLFHVGLHAAQNSGQDSRARTRDELASAIEVLPVELFQQAASVSARLDAADLFAAALRSVGAGSLCGRLGLPIAADTERAAAVESGRFLSRTAAERLFDMPWRRRPAYVLRQLTPSRVVLAVHGPGATTSRAAAVRAYAVRVRVGLADLAGAWRRRP